MQALAASTGLAGSARAHPPTQSHALTGTALPAAAPQCSRAPRPRTRLPAPVKAGIFDFFTGGGSARPTAKARPKAAELVEQLLQAAEGTDAGARVSAEQREQIEELVEELYSQRGRAPARSPQLFGTYKVVYASDSKAPGGPVLRSAPGRALLAGQSLRQTLAPPDKFENCVSFKTFGLLPSQKKQTGTIEILDGTRYAVNFDPKSLGRGESLRRLFEVLYLDERVRVVRFLGTGEEDDEQSDEIKFFVFERVAEAAAEEEDDEEPAADEDEEEEKQPQKRAPAVRLPLGFGTRTVTAQPTGAGTKVVRAGAAQAAAAAPAAPPSRGTRKLGRTPQEQAQERAKAQQERAKAARSAEDERDRAAARKSAVQRTLAQLTEEAQAARGEAAQLAKLAKDAERSGQAELRSAAGARAAVERAASATEAASDELAAAQAEEREIAEELARRIAQLRELEKAAAGRR